MAKGYWVVRLDVREVDRFQQYIAKTPAVLEEYGGRFLARGGKCIAAEGDARSRNSLIEFPSYEAAVDCYHSDGYQAAKALRAGAADVEILILEGLS